MNEQAKTKPDLRCYHHPEREATSQCDRCGDYLCDDCVIPLVEEQFCPECYRRYLPRWAFSRWIGEIAEYGSLPFRRLILFILCLLVVPFIAWAAVVISEWLVPFFR